MSPWEEASKLFEENSHSGKYFETQSAQIALKQIQKTIDSNFPQMVFLLGEPGSGKSFLLNYLTNYYREHKYCLLIENPFLSPTELLRRMLAFAHVDYEGNDVEIMRHLAIEAYTDTPHVIMIDEAQLTSAPLREFIRILSDSKVFWFLIAMHTQEGENLLTNPHFHSRPHKIIYMGEIKSDECLPYLQKTLHKPELWNFILNIKKDLIYKSWKYSKGNFRNLKKLYYNLFLLLDYANKYDRINFTKPNAQLFKMAYIKAGLDTTKKNIHEFDELVEATSSPIKQDKKSILKLASIGIAILLLLLLIIFGIRKFFFTQNENIAPKQTTQKTEIKQIKKEQAKEETNKTVVAKTIEQTHKEPIKIIQQKVEQNITEKKTNHKNSTLVFYAPIKNEAITKHIQEEKNYEAIPHTEDIIITDYPNSLEMEPNFLDNQKEYKPKHKGPLLEIKKSKPKATKAMQERFNASPSYELALEIAQIYFDKKDYKNASSWAKKANEIDRKQEDAWLLFAQSKYNEGKRKDAISALKLFLEYKQSQKAQFLLDEWEKNTFK